MSNEDDAAPINEFWPGVRGLTLGPLGLKVGGDGKLVVYSREQLRRMGRYGHDSCNSISGSHPSRTLGCSSSVSFHRRLRTMRY